VLCGFVGRCQHFGETCCLHLQGLSDKAGKSRACIGSEERRLREANQSERRNMGKGFGPIGSLQAGCEGEELGREWSKKRNGPFQGPPKSS
jgi:hypothetical protein